MSPFATGESSPVVVYLASLGSDRSRRVQKQRLDKIARLMTSGTSDCLSFPWEGVTYEIAQAIRTLLSEEISPQTGRQLSPSYVNAHLAALRGVLKEAWRLGLISEEVAHMATVDMRPADHCEHIFAFMLVSKRVTGNQQARDKAETQRIKDCEQDSHNNAITLLAKSTGCK